MKADERYFERPQTKQSNVRYTYVMCAKKHPDLCIIFKIRGKDYDALFGFDHLNR